MILERVYELALPRIIGKKIKEVRIGLQLLAVELDNGAIGVSYVLRKEIDHACEALPQKENLIGTPAKEIAGWAMHGKNVLTIAMGLAVLNSVTLFDELEHHNNSFGADAIFAAEIRPTDTIGIVGHIGPIISRLEDKVKQLIIFERGENLIGQVFPECAQPKLLPQCEVIFISSTSLINGTLENLLRYCTKARDIVLVGTGTPLYPEAFYGSGITKLAGTRWCHTHRDAVLTGISQCAGMQDIIKYGQKITVRVEE